MERAEVCKLLLFFFVREKSVELKIILYPMLFLTLPCFHIFFFSLLLCKSTVFIEIVRNDYTSSVGARYKQNAPPEQKQNFLSVMRDKNFKDCFFVYCSNKQKLPPTHSLSLLYRTPIIFPLLSRERLLVGTGRSALGSQK